MGKCKCEDWDGRAVFGTLLYISLMTVPCRLLLLIESRGRYDKSRVGTVTIKVYYSNGCGTTGALHIHDFIVRPVYATTNRAARSYICRRQPPPCHPAKHSPIRLATATLCTPGTTSLMTVTCK